MPFAITPLLVHNKTCACSSLSAQLLNAPSADDAYIFPQPKHPSSTPSSLAS
jgi:hypothetical protein